MKDRKVASVAPATAARAVPELPAWKAFVVQFNREARGQGTIFAGRIEHLSTGRRARFESSENLLAELEKLLAEVGGSATSFDEED